MVNTKNRVEIRQEYFGQTPDGVQVDRYLLASDSLRCSVLSYGAVIQQLEMRDEDGSWHNVVLGFDDLTAYLQRSPHFGGICGRHAGRIPNGQFQIGNQIHQLEQNFRAKHNLHGGSKGLDRRVWRVSPMTDGLQLRYTSPAGESGFPGEVEFFAYYRIVGCELQHHYYATSNQATPINLNNHSYFNLGKDSSSIEGHQLRINASRYAPLDQEFLYTAPAQAVDNSVFDFRCPALVSERLKQGHPQFEISGGFDHGFFLQPQQFWAIELTDLASRRRLRIHTDQEVVIFYSGNSLSKQVNPLAAGRETAKQGAICLETQDLPAAFIRNPDKLTTPTRPYRALTVWRLDHAPERAEKQAG